MPTRIFPNALGVIRGHDGALHRRNYKSNLSETHPESWLQAFTDRFYRYDLRVESYDVAKIDVCTAAFSIDGTKLDLNAWKGDISVFRLDSKRIDLKIATMKTAIRLASAKLLVTGALIAVLLRTPFKSNAFPSPTPSTPFD